MPIHSPKCPNTTGCYAKGEVKEFAERVRKVYLQRPNDEEAGRRAQVAAQYYHDFHHSCPTPPLQPLHPLETAIPVEEKDVVFSLPMEIYMNIIGCAGDQIGVGTRTCKLFQYIAEEHIYRLLPFRGLADKVWQFQFSITIEPRRASLVRSLYIRWDEENENCQRLIDIVRACPNVHSLALKWMSPRRVRGYRRRNLRDDGSSSMRELFRSCPKVKTFRFSGFPPDSYSIPDIHEASFYSHITELETDVDSIWGHTALTRYDFSNVTTLHLGQGFPEFIAFSMPARIPRPVYQNITGLRNLEISIRRVDFISLKDACIAWGPTLQRLCLRIPDYDDDYRFGELIRHFPFLEEFLVLSKKRLKRKLINSITTSSWLTTPRLRTVVLGDTSPHFITELSNVLGKPIEKALEALIDTLHPTLETLYMGYHTPVQTSLLQHLKKAKNLRRLRLYLEEDAKQEDIDGLSECTKLDTFRVVRGNRTYPSLIAGELIEVQRWEGGWSDS
ncbi:hypothetical protein FCULG_00005497 [Fusarium culmorum]|uniref:Uncharacterized protein n=1 Tax=Fusarium culmorum TaxID=5516 RepID=A0A2T4GTK8_FUSCU|nr:hypothetical protein FCULG_00005497 [Fusarium culmorum]